MKALAKMINCIEYSAPSNIALVKYWGKREVQLPQNPSISFTLDKSLTTTKVTWESGAAENIETEFLFEGAANKRFEKKIIAYRKLWEESFPVLKKLNLKIESQNTFPHSAGIASSASSMASLSLCFSHIVKTLEESSSTENNLENASHMARLGSGSACRSIYGGINTWGKWREGTSDRFASTVTDLPESWSNWGDAILLVSSCEKPVSSSVGHALMDNHPYAKTRYEQATKRVFELHKIMLEERVLDFCELVEKEALELHGLMMNSTPSFILMKPESLAIIEKVRAFRESQGINICFTLDAGPNIHLLYPLSNKVEVMKFINEELTIFLESGSYIDDRVGKGPSINNV